MTDTYIISAEDNNEDVTELVKHVADLITRVAALEGVG
jgi:hypothetical protein